MNTHVIRPSTLLAALVGLFLVTGCATAPSSQEGRSQLEKEAAEAVAKAKRTDPSMVSVLDSAAGYAVIPSVAKGAIGVGGAHGQGVLFESGTVVGYCDLSQATIGFQLGGQAYTEIIAFQGAKDVANFREGHFAFAAQATAVAVKAGAGANSDYKDGAAVFTLDEAGLMYEASVGGQKFSYIPK
jgi:lipid-binding SYLF domain-containing protein